MKESKARSGIDLPEIGVYLTLYEWHVNGHDARVRVGFSERNIPNPTLV